MSKVTIHTKNGEQIEVNAAPHEEAFYDDLPFTSENVMITEIRPKR
ncbi:hypothetical protein AB0C27_07970 [Nonomuraea sp. NPDC048882]|uniref:Uncharacterized protein n=1 Tax=Nonomuraea maheshkhaliensis TaxID=419590 RepID=A0ABP4QIS8_9ACTN